MTDEGEEKKETTGEEVKGTEKVTEQSTEGQIVLTPQQYAALLDRIDELESKPAKVRTLDQLAEEAKPTKTQTEEKVKPPVDLDELTPKQLVEYVFEAVNEAFAPIAQDLGTKVETLRVLRELDKCEAKYPDFWDFKDETYQIALANPGMSVEDAYVLAKTKSGGKKGPTGDKEKGTLLTLPPRPVLGERPGATPSATREVKPKDLRSAAERAWDDLEKGEKKEK